MFDIYNVLDVALRSRYLTPAELPAAPVWDRLPAELRAALVVALESGGVLGTVIPVIWQVRAALHSRPVWNDEGSTAYVRMRLGLQYLAHLKGACGADELLSRAFHTADSYVWDKTQQQDFFDCRREVKQAGPDAANLAALFAPYHGDATRCVEEWGLA